MLAGACVGTRDRAPGGRFPLHVPLRLGLLVWLLASVSRPAFPQGIPSAQIRMLQAEQERTMTAVDVTATRLSARSGNPETARTSLRILGRLERVSLIPDILPALRHVSPGVRSEAANALAQATQGLTTAPESSIPHALASAQSALIARLAVEGDANVRGALCEALARLPYRAKSDFARAERAILGLAAGDTLLADRLSLAKALEVFVRQQATVGPPSAKVVAALLDLARGDARSRDDLLRESRVRRLALEGLTTAGAVDDLVVQRASGDPDPQVRRLAMRAVAISGAGRNSLRQALADPAAMVRLEALRASRARGAEGSCDTSLAAASDGDLSVALTAVDQLGACAQSAQAVAYLERTVADVGDLTHQRGWHLSAHALVALAAAAPDKASSVLARYTTSRIWQVRLYAARAARLMRNEAVLEVLAADDDPRVANVALAGLGRPPRPAVMVQSPAPSPMTEEQVRAFAAPRARVTIRDVGLFELALLTWEAPATVIRFVTLAQAGYYNGLSFDRLVANATAQAGERLTGETATYSSREIGTWPHVRGTVGLAGPDTGDAQFFINLVDNPLFDHQYAVFAQVLNGADVIDRLLEGDVIESIVILP